MREANLSAADRMKGNGLKNGAIQFVSMSRFQIYIVLSDSSRYEVPRDSTTSAGPVAGWPNLTKSITEMERPLFSDQNTVRIIKFCGQVREISRSRFSLWSKVWRPANSIANSNKFRPRSLDHFDLVFLPLLHTNSTVNNNCVRGSCIVETCTFI